ncbi:hypothetical protein XI06_31795 [Bradyrhizobium sp. CCBAU 11434]|uniref:hypothetical protein n=1 Tax=Bradyrhizobium sp. CCBAU 11434 TaxID=1630885 RepID=UPI0023054619|nr:hypothetical protein [Bradyrhizobium sp. CCBAU 11434]MDA9524755.1 hypothetical protein [Bradyrhizobium sp. CCBAU 11434]
MTRTRADLLRREILPFFAAFAALVLVALLVDAVLHAFGKVWIGRYLGIPGTLLILASFSYSLNKRKLLDLGRPVQLLVFHQRMAWAGSLLILVHAGVHFNAILPWLAVGAMLTNVGSGLTGKYLLKSAGLRLESARQKLREEGVSQAALDEQLYWDSLAFDAVRQWKIVHLPITLAFAVLAIAHVVTVLLFWGWR